MDANQIAAGFDQVIAAALAAGDGAAADRARLFKAYFTDPAFRAAMADEVARINNA